MSDVRLFFRYVLPSMGGMLIAGVYSVVDTFFIGLTRGETGLGAVTLTWPLIMVVMGLGDLIGTGAAILISQRRGAGEAAAANRLFSVLIGLELLAALVLPLLVLPILKPLLGWLGATPELLPGAWSYSAILIGFGGFQLLTMGLLAALRNDGRPALAMGLISCGLLANIVLDYLLVIVFDWGLVGAAWATVLAQALALVLCAGCFFTRRTTLRASRRLARPDWATVRAIVKYGLPTLGAQLAIGAMVLCHNYQALAYGGGTALAAYAVICTVESVGSMLMTGIASGLQPIASFFHGAGKYRRNRRIGRLGLWFALGLGVVMTLFSVAACHFMPWVMGLTGLAAAEAARGLLIGAPTFLLLGVVRVGGYFLQSTGRVGAASALIYGDSCLILPLCLVLLPLAWGLDGVWAAMPVSRVVLAALLFWFWRRPEGNYNWLGGRTANDGCGA